MIIEVILVVIFATICAGDCYSTAKLLKHNEKMVNDKNYKRKVKYRISKKLKSDVSQSEMCPFTSKLVRKYGGTRAMLYLGVFAYGPLSLALFYLLLTEGIETLILTVFLIGFMVGALFMQIMKAITLEKRFGVNVWRD